MLSSSLLADLALRLAGSPEDVATEALTLILGRSEPARQAMNSLLMEWSGTSNRPIARWRSQVCASDDSRTDMEGEDENGSLWVILENKFWAGLTPNQPTTYLKRLPVDGVLAFVAPKARLSVLAVELAERLRLGGLEILEFRTIGYSRIARVSSSQTLVVTSWDAILTSMSTALEASQDYDGLADVRQLQGLAARMDSIGFLPLSSTDITGPSARRLVQFCEILDEAVRLFLTRTFVNRKGLRASAGAGWYGHYLRIHDYGCQIIFAAKRWSTSGISPIWFRVSTNKWKYPQGLHGPMAETLSDPAWLQEDKDGSDWAGLWLPIRLVEGRDKDVVVADVVKQLDRIAGVLAAHPIAGPPTEPPQMESREELSSVEEA